MNNFSFTFLPGTSAYSTSEDYAENTPTRAELRRQGYEGWNKWDEEQKAQSIARSTPRGDRAIAPEQAPSETSPAPRPASPPPDQAQTKDKNATTSHGNQPARRSKRARQKLETDKKQAWDKKVAESLKLPPWY